MQCPHHTSPQTAPHGNLPHSPTPPRLIENPTCLIRSIHLALTLFLCSTLYNYMMSTNIGFAHPSLLIPNRTSTHLNRSVTPITITRRRLRIVALASPPPPSLPTIEPAFADITTRLLATTADIGPFTNVDVETAGLIAAILAGALVASIIIIVIVRF